MTVYHWGWQPCSNGMWARKAMFVVGGLHYLVKFKPFLTYGEIITREKDEARMKQDEVDWEWCYECKCGTRHFVSGAQTHKCGACGRMRKVER